MANVLTNPENFTSGWLTVSQGVINANQAVAPDGTLTADELVDDGSTGSGSAGVQQTGISLTASTQYVASIFAKPNNGDRCGIIPSNWTPPGTANTYADVLNGLITGTNGTVDASGIIQYVNGWWRAYGVFTIGGDTGGAMRFYSCEADDSIVLADCDGSHSIYIWGAVLEPGDYPTDYVSVGGTPVFPVSGGLTFSRDLARDLTRDLARDLAG